nr:immunoglobulin heavy chain junction region [Mus musculus]
CARPNYNYGSSPLYAMDYW